MRRQRAITCEFHHGLLARFFAAAHFDRAGEHALKALVETAPHILALQFTLSFVAYAALSFWYVWPWLRTKPPTTALAILVFPQTFRFIGFTLLLPGVVAPGLPDEFARCTAIGDGVTTLLAWLSLIALRAGWRLAVPLVWLFNLVGLGDLLLNLSRGIRLQVASLLGAAWFGPAFIVPGMLVIHLLIFVSLRRGGPRVV